MDGDMIMIYAIGGFVLLMLSEYIYGVIKKSNLYRLNDTITNLNIGIGSQIFGLLYKVVIVGAMVGIYKQFHFFDIPTNAFTILVIAVFYDFLFYWAHRWGHEMNFFWGSTRRASSKRRIQFERSLASALVSFIDRIFHFYSVASYRL